MVAPRLRDGPSTDPGLRAAEERLIGLRGAVQPLAAESDHRRAVAVQHRTFVCSDAIPSARLSPNAESPWFWLVISHAATNQTVVRVP